MAVKCEANAAGRPDTPVRHLELLARRDAAVVIQQVLQAIAWKTEETGCLMRVKHSDDVDSEIALKPQHVMVGTMKHLQSTAH